MLKPLSHKKKKFPRVLITAGPTLEKIDPVRYISNFSTGIMGYSIAEYALSAGCGVDLVSGPVNLSPPDGACFIPVSTALEMEEAVGKRLPDADCIIMSAAVCDFRVKTFNSGKIKKTGSSINLELVENPDILKNIGSRKDLIKAGFALETDDPVANGRKKLEGKSLDFIIINTVGKNNDPFGEGINDYTIMDKTGTVEENKALTKKQVAEIIINKVIELYGKS